MSNIRLTYTGIKYFTLQVLSYIIGVAFPIYVARTVPQSDFGIYGFIASLWATFDIFKTMIPFWAGRMIARGGRFTKSTLVSNLLLSIPLCAIYLLVMPYFPSVTGNYRLIYVISTLYIPISYGISALRAYVGMKATDKLGYGPIIFSIVKITIGFVFVYILGILGAIVTLLMGYTLVLLYFLRLSLREFEEEIVFHEIKEWIKGSWFVLALSISAILNNNLPVLTLGFIGTPASLGSFYVAVKVSTWIGLTTSLSIALSPRLLSEAGGRTDVHRTINLLLLFATPMLIGIIAMDKELVYLFGGLKYMDASIPLTILALAKYLNVFTIVGISTVLGYEKFDKQFKIRIRELFGSDMFKILLYRYIGLVVLVFSIITLYPFYKLIGLALAVLISSVVLFILVTRLSFKRIYSLKEISDRLSKYFFSSIIMGIVVYLLPKYRTLLIIASVFVGIAIYFLILYIIDDDFRYLIRRGIDELNKILMSLTLEE